MRRPLARLGEPALGMRPWLVGGPVFVAVPEGRQQGRQKGSYFQGTLRRDFKGSFGGFLGGYLGIQGLYKVCVYMYMYDIRVMEGYYKGIRLRVPSRGPSYPLILYRHDLG